MLEKGARHCIIILVLVMVGRLLDLRISNDIWNMMHVMKSKMETVMIMMVQMMIVQMQVQEPC